MGTELEQDDQTCEPVEWALNKAAFLRWLNNQDAFMPGSFVVTDVLLVGRPLTRPRDLHLILLLVNRQMRLTLAKAFDFSLDTLRPFLTVPK